MKHARADYDRIQDPEGRIPDDEPVFLIRGQDAVGSAAVLVWAALAEDRGADRRIVAAARKQAVKMKNWKRHKTPDMPA